MPVTGRHPIRFPFESYCGRMQLLAPPLAANMLVLPSASMKGTLALKSPLTEVEPFPGTSGMYPNAEVKFAVLVSET